jgi:pyruvate dehydrogenase E1 component beta subunit
MGGSWREAASFDVPPDGTFGPTPRRWLPLPLGKAAERQSGEDLTIASLGVGVHRALQAAEILAGEGLSVGVLDLRSVAPLDKDALCNAVRDSGRLLVVDEDYEGFGLSGELAALTLEAGIPLRYRRVCTRETIPYARHLEDQVLPNVDRIVQAAKELSAL